MGFLSGLFEKRYHPSQDPEGWLAGLRSGVQGSGVYVTPETSLQATAVYACVRVLAETMAGMPLFTYKRLANGGKEKALDHPLYPILHHLPNPEMTSFDMREALMGHVLLYGNCYAEIERNMAGRVKALWPLRPDKMTVSRKNGNLRYTYRLPSAAGNEDIELDASQVLHVRGLGSNGIVGFSPIEMAARAIGMSIATEQFGETFFSNGASPSGVLEHPGKLGEEAHKRMRNSWEDMHKGLENSHRIAILEEGVSYKQIGIKPEEAQFLETRKYQRGEIAMIYRVPPHMIGDLERSTFSNIEHQSIDFVVHSVRPWLVRWEQEYGRSLLTEAERKGYFIEHLVDGLLRGDIQSRYNAYGIGRQWGWFSINDVRSLENLNPVEGGDIYMVPLNMMPADQIGKGLPEMESSKTAGSSEPVDGDGEEEEEEGNPVRSNQVIAGRDSRRNAPYEERSAQVRHRLQQSYWRVYREAAARILKREMADVSKALKKYVKPKEKIASQERLAMTGEEKRKIEDFQGWLYAYYEGDIRSFVIEVITPVAMAYGEVAAAEAQEEIAVPVEMNDELVRWVGVYVAAFAARHASISLDRILGAIFGAEEAGEDVYGAVDGLISSWDEGRADETANWESVRFGNALAKKVYVDGGRTQIRWVAFGENCPYCNSLNGRVVGIQENFLSAGTNFQPDGAGSPLSLKHDVGHAPAHAGCDCMVMAS